MSLQWNRQWFTQISGGKRFKKTSVLGVPSFPCWKIRTFSRLLASLTQAGWAICSETHDEWWRYLIELQHGPPIDSSNVSGWMPWLGGSLHRWKLLSPHKWRSPVCLMVGMPRKIQMWRCTTVILIAGVLPGPLQSAFRAELYAVYQAISWAVCYGCKNRLWTDCQGVVTKLQGLLAGTWKPQTNSNHFEQGSGFLTSLLSSHWRRVLPPKLRRINQLLCQSSWDLGILAQLTCRSCSMLS